MYKITNLFYKQPEDLEQELNDLLKEGIETMQILSISQDEGEFKAVVLGRDTRLIYSTLEETEENDELEIIKALIAKNDQISAAICEAKNMTT